MIYLFFVSHRRQLKLFYIFESYFHSKIERLFNEEVEFKEFIKQYCITEYDHFTEEQKILFAQQKEEQILDNFGVITLDEFKNFFNTKDKEWFKNHNIKIGFYYSFKRFIPKHNQMINQEQL